MTDASLVHLRGLTSLQTLNLTETQVTDAGLVHLKGLTGLQKLTLHKTQVTPTGLREIQSALPKCRIGPANPLVSRSSDLGANPSRGVEATPSIISADDHVSAYDPIQMSTNGDVEMLEWEGMSSSSDVTENPPRAAAYEFLITVVEDAGGKPGSKPLAGSGSFKVTTAAGSSATSHAQNGDSRFSHSHVGPDEVSETFVKNIKWGETTASWYKYRIALSNPIQLEAGKNYWVSVTAISNTKHSRPSWNWTSGRAQNASRSSIQRSGTGKYFERKRNRTFSIYSSGVRPNKDAALAAIKELGGRITFDAKNPDKPVVVDLGDSDATDASLVHLKGLTSLQTLNLTETQVTDAGLVHLKGLRGLQTLTLHKTRVTSTGVKDLQAELPKCRIGPANALVSRPSDLGAERTYNTWTSLIYVDGRYLVYDSFQMSTNGDVGMLEWEGLYTSTDLSANPPSAAAYEFLITVVEDAGGGPGSKSLPGGGSFKVADAGGLSAASTPQNGDTRFSHSQVSSDEVSETFVKYIKWEETTASWYKYRITLSNPIRLEAGKKYWMSIAAKTNTKVSRPSWSWNSGNAQNASSSSFQSTPNGEHVERTRNRTFSIYSSGVRQHDGKE